MSQLTRQLGKSQRGQSLLEMALVLPLILIILFGVMEFGRIFHSYLVITHAAREGARFGVISKDVNQIKQKVQEASTGITVELDNIDVNPSGSISPGVPVTVSVEHDIELFTPVIANLLPNPVHLTASSTMRAE